MRRRNTAGWAGVFIGLLGLAFAAGILVRGWPTVQSAPKDWRFLVVAVTVGVLSMALIGLNWLLILSSTRSQLSYLASMSWYFTGQLGKYIPGGFWPVVGRSELAVRGGVARNIAYPSVAMSLITTYAAAAVAGSLALLVSGAGGTDTLGFVAIALAVAAGSVIALHPAVLQSIARLGERALGRSISPPHFRWSISLRAILLTLPSWFGIGVATYFVARALGFDPELSAVVAATAYSWLIGFLAVPVPSGIGIREGIFTALYPGTTAEGAAVALIARLVFVFVDLIGFALSRLLATWRRPQSSATESA